MAERNKKQYVLIHQRLGYHLGTASQDFQCKFSSIQQAQGETLISSSKRAPSSPEVTSGLSLPPKDATVVIDRLELSPQATVWNACLGLFNDYLKDHCQILNP